jgi:hypothetical protein
VTFLYLLIKYNQNNCYGAVVVPSPKGEEYNFTQCNYMTIIANFQYLVNIIITKIGEQCNKINKKFVSNIAKKLKLAVPWLPVGKVIQPQ